MYIISSYQYKAIGSKLKVMKDLESMSFERWNKDFKYNFIVIYIFYYLLSSNIGDHEWTIIKYINKVITCNALI